AHVIGAIHSRLKQQIPLNHSLNERPASSLHSQKERSMIHREAHRERGEEKSTAIKTQTSRAAQRTLHDFRGGAMLHRAA
ncbi:MAG TPA: hypothetical protein PK400_04095, partial [Phycisphaerales bacterium]|nr:hypothetical protein [Phycisphaerales bacterium]